MNVFRTRSSSWCCVETLIIIVDSSWCYVETLVIVIER